MTVAALANEYIAGDYSDNAKALAKAILVYGAAAQKQFSFRGNDLANQYLDDEDKEPAAYTADDIKSFTENDTDVPTGRVDAPLKDMVPYSFQSDYGLKYEGCTLHEFRYYQEDDVSKLSKIKSFAAYRKTAKKLLKAENYDFIQRLQQQIASIL